LWATLDVLDSLRYGDAEVLTDDVGLLKRINLLADDVNRQLSLSEHMSEVLASGLEVLQTIYNNQLQMLNNRLAFLATWLAIAGTAVLVPNTLATIYGISAVSEHLSYSFVVWSLVMSIVISTVLVFLVIKWKEWMPRKLDL
jgi:magnesium transporter